jgi:hypothetical protein
MLTCNGKWEMRYAAFLPHPRNRAAFRQDILGDLIDPKFISLMPILALHAMFKIHHKWTSMEDLVE